MDRLNILFICQVVDVRDPIMATAVQWIETLAAEPRVGKVTVLALRDGEHSFNRSVTVKKIGGGGRVFTLLRFYMNILYTVLRGKVSSFLIYQGGSYPILLLPFKIFLKIPIFQWRAHPHVSFMARFYLKYCTTVHFTSTRSSFIDAPNVRRIGQGVNIEKFNTFAVKKKRDLITVGRISPIKKIELMIEAVYLCRKIHNRSLTLDIYGPVFPGDEDYLSLLREMVGKWRLEEQVFFRGAVDHGQLPYIFNEHRLSLNISETALDRAVVEAMACGVPVVSSNPCVEEVMPEQYRESLVLHSNDASVIAGRVNNFFLSDNDDKEKMAIELRDNIVKNHSHTGQIEIIVDEMVRVDG